MKHIFFTSILLLSAVCGYAQQEQQYTQFMFNKLGFNPGYAGSYDAPCISLLHRSQWLGLEGAPTTQVLNFHMPLLNKRVGIGLNMVRHTIGITESWTANGAYSYRIKMRRGTLGLGIQASMRYLGMDFTDSRLEATQSIQGDGGIPIGIQNKYLPNFGVGAYYSSRSFYLGLSAPRLLENNIDFSDVGPVLSSETRHLFFMAGVLLPLSEKVDFQPQLFLKYANNTPLDADINASLIFNDRFTFGATYRVGGSSESRLGESIDILVASQVGKNVLFGISYDITLSDLRDYNDGSIEAMLRFCFDKPEGEEFINPRFF